MSNSKACILDHNSLGDLNNAFEYAADSVLKVQKAISDYLKGVIEVMEEQLEIVEKKFEQAKERLESAKERLAMAEEAYEAARESMNSSMDEADGVASTLACAAYGAISAAATGVTGAAVAAAKADCEMAQKSYDKWEKNYEKAKEVVSDCKGYKSDWDYQDPFFSGGDFHLEMLGTSRTDEATQKLKKILEIVDKYLNVEFSSHASRNTEEVEVLDKYDKRKIIEDSNYKVRGEQIHELNRHDAKGATRVAKCNNCGRPLSICICGNSRKNIDLV